MNSAAWLTPHTWPSLAANDVHVWLADLPSLRSNLPEFVAVLSSEECERVARFRFVEHRERSQIARGILRLLLARYTGVGAAVLRFVHNEHGKPRLPSNELFFNTSHSGDYATFAFTRLGAVGVDIEQAHEKVGRRDQIAEKHFAPGEQRQLSALPECERARAFFDLWTRKEAFVKARGDGLFSGLDQFETLLNEPRLVSIRGEPVMNWWMSALPEVPGYSAAVVVNAPSCTPHFWRWNQSLLREAAA